MSKTYRLTERAEADVEAIADFIAGESVDAAVKVVLALEDAFCPAVVAVRHWPRA